MAATIDFLGSEFTHTICAMDGNFDAAYRLNGTAEVRFQPPPEKRGWGHFLSFRNLLKQIRPDMVATYNWGAIEALLGAELAGNCVLLHNEHGFGPDEAFRLKTRRVLARRVLLRRIFRMLVPSKNLLNIALTRYRVPARKVKYIASGVDLNRFKPGLDRGLRTRLGVDPDTVLFGYVGLLRPEKNLELMLRAFSAAHLSNTKLVFVGDGTCRQGLEALAQSLGVRERVIFAGATRDPVPYYAAFDAALLSSTTEQMPMAMVEAMACGLPVLSTAVGDAADMLGGAGPPEIVVSQDLEGYTQALRALGEDASLRDRLGRKNRQRCIEHYNFERMASEYGAVYRSASELVRN
jgi:glycosyltransferase involved in cell wall biosynthesis